MTNGAIRNGSVLLVLWSLVYFMPEDFAMPIGAVLAAFAAGHLISVFENLYFIGVPIPALIEEHLYKTKAFKQKLSEINYARKKAGLPPFGEAVGSMDEIIGETVDALVTEEQTKTEE